jgi:hypothetical protein
LIRRHKGLQDGVGELLLKVLNMKWDTKMIGDATRIVSGIESAAALAMTVTLIGGAMQTHPNTDHFMTGLDEEGSSNRRVNPAGERYEDAFWLNRFWCCLPTGWKTTKRSCGERHAGTAVRTRSSTERTSVAA